MRQHWHGLMFRRLRYCSKRIYSSETPKVPYRRSTDHRLPMYSLNWLTIDFECIVWLDGLFVFFCACYACFASIYCLCIYCAASTNKDVYTYLGKSYYHIFGNFASVPNDPKNALECYDVIDTPYMLPWYPRVPNFTQYCSTVIHFQDICHLSSSQLPQCYISIFFKFF